MSALVSYRLESTVATIAMDDGKMNALSPQLLSELASAFDRAERDGAVIVLEGRPGVFSAGFDLKVLSAGGDAAVSLLHAGFSMAERMLSYPYPVIVACSGHAIAMGVFLLLAADYRIGTEGAFRITANEVAIGMTLPRAAIEICRQRLAPAHFNRVVTLAELYTPASAVDAGLLDRVVPAAELSTTAQQTAAALAKLNMKAHAATKLRARASMLATMRAAIEQDSAEFRARVGATAQG